MSSQAADTTTISIFPEELLLSAGQVEGWTGRALDAEELVRLRAEIAASPVIQQAVVAIVAHFTRSPVDVLWETVKRLEGEAAQTAAVAALVESYVREVAQPAIAARARPTNGLGDSAAALLALAPGWCVSRTLRSEARSYVEASAFAQGPDGTPARRVHRALQNLDRRYLFDALDALGDEWLSTVVSGSGSTTNDSTESNGM